MSTQISWTIQWMKSSTQLVNGFPEVVLECGWICTGADGDYTGQSYSTCTFTPPQEGDPNFVPYNQLSQEDVLNWCWNSGVNKEATEAAVQQQIDLAKNPPAVILPNPWSSPSA